MKLPQRHHNYKFCRPIASAISATPHPRHRRPHAMSSSDLPPLPVPTMNDDFSASLAVKVKREAEIAAVRPSTSKKPRDNRLRDCFTITPIEEGGEDIVCKHCEDYHKILQKFNPTKGRQHLTDYCPGVDDTLRQVLLESTQAAKKVKLQYEIVSEAVEALGAVPATPGASAANTPGRNRKTRGRSRPSPAYISFHTGTTSLVSTS